jgi:regulatory protein
MAYIASRAASTAMLRQTLERRAKRRLAVRSLEPATIADIDAVIGGLVTLGLVDDQKFAAGRAATLANKGLPRRRVAEGLRLKGIAQETIEQVIEPDLDDTTQARRFVERKRLGSFRRGGMTPESRQKDLRALARAGFSFRAAACALDEPGE